MTPPRLLLFGACLLALGCDLAPPPSASPAHFEVEIVFDLPHARQPEIPGIVAVKQTVE